MLGWQHSAHIFSVRQARQGLSDGDSVGGSIDDDDSADDDKEESDEGDDGDDGNDVDDDHHSCAH